MRTGTHEHECPNCGITWPCNPAPNECRIHHRDLCPQCAREAHDVLTKKYNDAVEQIDSQRKALEKHVCVKAIQGDGMNAVEYHPVDEDECELCAVLKPKDPKPRPFVPKSTPYDTSGSRGEPETPA